MFHPGSSSTDEFLFFASYITYVVCKAKVSNVVDCNGNSALVLLSSFKEDFKDRGLHWLESFSYRALVQPPRMRALELKYMDLLAQFVARDEELRDICLAAGRQRKTPNIRIIIIINIVFVLSFVSYHQLLRSFNIS